MGTHDLNLNTVHVHVYKSADMNLIIATHAINQFFVLPRQTTASID